LNVFGHNQNEIAAVHLVKIICQLLCMGVNCEVWTQLI